ncbi:MAG: glycosyltransferase family 1 protein [Chitinophagaceae bacterium]|nr:MAG: glycosyltransferase family 1 protein [Chitinophagaceae bacterium]
MDCLVRLCLIKQDQIASCFILCFFNYLTETIAVTIFLSFLQGRPDHPIPAYQFWEYYIKNGIEEAGDQWMEAQVDWAEGLLTQSGQKLERWRANAWEKTIVAIKRDRPDLFLSYLYPHQIEASALQQIRDLGVPTVNFFCDNVREFTRVPPAYQSFDLHWVPEYKALKMYSTARLPYLHLPMPMWVPPVHRHLPSKEISSVCFIGSKDVQRHLLFEEVVKKKPDFPLEIYGAAWQDEEQKVEVGPVVTSTAGKIRNQVTYLSKHGLLPFYRKLAQRNAHFPVSDELALCLKGRPSFNEYIALTSGSLVTLGVNRYPSFRFPVRRPDSYSRLRDIEAPMLGACYLTERTEGLDKYYDLGSDIETYSSAAELIDKVVFLLKEPKIREQLRINGQTKALNELSIPHSIKLLKKHFGIR